jgi:ankyrin repeat protein
MGGHVTTAKLLLKAGANINARDKVSDMFGSDVFHLIRSSPYLLTSLYLLTAFLFTLMKYGWTALMRAASGAQVDAVKFLVNAGAEKLATCYGVSSEDH